MADIIRETDEYVRYDIDFDEIVDAAQQVEEAAEGYDDLNARFTAMDDRIDQAQQAIHFKGFVNYYSDLPNSPMENDAYTVLYSGTSGTDPDGTEYIWSNRGGTYEWNPWGKSTYTQSQIDDKLAHIKANQVDGMTGYSMPSSTSAIAASDTLNAAVGKLEKGVDLNKNNILSVWDKAGRNELQFNGVGGGNDYTVSYTNNNGIVTVNGTATGGTSYNYLRQGTTNIDISKYCNGDYYLFGCPPDGDIDTKYALYASKGNYLKVDNGNGVLLTQTTETPVYAVIRVAQNYTADNLQFKPMIIHKSLVEAGDITFEPYAMSNAELTAKEQTNENNILTYAIPTCTDTAFTTSTTGAYVYTGIAFTVPSGEVWEFFVADKYNGSGTTNFSNGLLVSDSSSAITNVSVIAENTQVPSVSGISYWVRQLTGLTPKRTNATTYYVWTNRAVTTSCNIFVCLRRVF